VATGYFQGSGPSNDDDAYPTAEKLSYHEFISSLKPSNRHIMTELSGFLQHPNGSPLELHNRLLQGTSIERRALEEVRNRDRNSYYRRSRMRDIDPGMWAEDEGPSGGIMTSLSPVDSKSTSASRSMHQNFALATSLRPLPSRVGDVVSTYTTCMMEGVGIRYRPQRSIATVVGQSLDSLTGSGSRAYAAGSYWKTVLGPKANTTQVLSVLGNTTRIHSYLKSTASGLSSALSRKYSGYLSRDGMSGLAPEKEDCSDAVESCLSLRDIYESSMGFDEDDEGMYFSDNSD